MNRVEFGDCRDTMRRWAADGVKVQTCVTSPPYFGLRDYGHAGQIGLERTPAEYVKAMVEVFSCVWDVLADDGVLWLNLGDSYANDSKRAEVIPGQSVGTHRPDREESTWDTEMRNRRSVWTVATVPYSGAHFATFPPALIEPCILAGSKPGQIVLDPFFGSGTTGMVAQNLGRQFLGCELNPEYKPLQDERLQQPGLMLEAA